jgi:DNA primase
VVLLFDSDSAGHKAMVRAAEIILGGDWVVRVVALPEGEDPDSFIRRVGKEVFETYVQKAIPLMDFVVQSYLTDRPALGIQDKVQMSRHLFPYIAKLSSHLEQGYYLKQLAERLDVSEQDLVAEYREASRKGETRKVVSTLTERTAYPKDEEILCHLLLHGKIEGERLRPLLEGFSDSRLRGVVQAILEVLETGGKADVDKILHLCSGTQEEVQFLSGLMLRELEYDDVKKTAEDCLATVYRRWIQRQLKATERAIASAEKEGDLEAVRNLQRSIIQLRGRTRPDTALTQQPYAV